MIRFMRLSLVGVIAFSLVFAHLGGSVGASADDDADYTLPGRLALPWACGEAYRVTWAPADHWEWGKATGVAYDFGLVEGTPVFAPAAGVAYFLQDRRPLATNLGNYVEIVIEDQWLVRLAHLRDEQSGEREVAAGELIGYSGRSGVEEAHLHLELLVRRGAYWVRPDVSRLDRLYGVDRDALFIDAMVLNDRCPALLSLAQDVRPQADGGAGELGEPLDLIVTVQNDGLSAVDVEQVAVSMVGPGGQTQSARQEGAWRIAGISRQDIAVTVHPREAGIWQVIGVNLTAGGSAYRLEASGRYEVMPGSLGLVGVSSVGQFAVDEPITMEVWLEARGDKAIAVDDVLLWGQTDDGEVWEGRADHVVDVPASGLRRVVVASVDAPRSVGQWRISQVGAVRGSHEFVLARPDQAFVVSGAELIAERLSMRASQVVLMLANVGDMPLVVESVDLWGNGAGATDYLRATDGMPLNLAPGTSQRVTFDLGDSSVGIDFVPIDAGAWAGTEYYPVVLRY